MVMAKVAHAIVGEFIDALVNDRQRAEVLLSAQPDLLNARWMHDETVVHFLAVEGFLDAVTFLAERGADLNLVNEFGDVPLIDIAALGFNDVAEVLLRHGADPNVRAGSAGRFNALDCGVRAGNSVLVEMLLRAGASAIYVTDLGETIFDVLPESRNDRGKILAVLARYGHKPGTG